MTAPTTKRSPDWNHRESETSTNQSLSGPPRYLKAEEVAEYFRWSVDETTAKRRLRNIPPAELPYIQVGRDRLYQEEDIHNYMRSRRVS
jgi:hypothetical protein